MVTSNSAACDSKTLRFFKQQEASGLLSSLGIRTPLSQIPLVDPFLFQRYKMNEMINNFLVAGDTFMPLMHLKQSGFRYISCGPLN